MFHPSSTYDQISQAGVNLRHMGLVRRLVDKPLQATIMIEVRPLCLGSFVLSASQLCFR